MFVPFLLVLMAVLLVVAVLLTLRKGRLLSTSGSRYETPNHLYPSALVADEDGGDAPEFVLPEDLTALSAEYDDGGNLTGGELHDLETQAVNAFDAIRAGDMNADDLANLAQLADAVDAIRTESTRRVTEAAEHAAQAAALADRVHPAASAEGDEPGDGDGDEPADGEGDEPADDAANAGAEPVLAGGTPRGPIRVPLGRIRDRAPAPAPLNGQAAGLPDGLAIVAAADVPGFANGGEVADKRALAQAMHARARGLSMGGQALVASIQVDQATTITAEDTRETMLDAMVAAADPEALVAAGGWCAPSDRIWEFFGDEAVTGLVDVPTVGITRGGLEFPISPSLGDVFDVPWLWTEADDTAAAGNPHEDPDDDRTKPCFRVPCPGWHEVRLRAHGLCVTAGNLTDAAWPEATRRYVDLVVAAHRHVMNGRNLTAMVALADAVAITDPGNATATLLNSIELQVLDYRDKYRMGDSVLLEAVFDMWVKGIIRADIARRGGVAIEDVPDSRITGWFADRGVRPQFVHDFHPLNLGGAGGFRTTWPTSVTFLLYAAGTYVRGTGPTLDLGVVRDSRLNEVNDHTAAWTEESDLIAKVGHEARVVTVPVVPNGKTSIATTPPNGPLV